MTARHALKTLAASGLDRSGLRFAVAAVRRVLAGGRRVVVLGYHRVVDDFERERRLGLESTLISREAFRSHVAFLAERFRFVTMSEAVEVLAGRLGSRRDVVALTFDDGYADLVTNALPVLRAYHAPATLYVSTGVVDRAGHFPHDRLYALLSAEARPSDEEVATSLPPRLRDAFVASGTDGTDPRRRLHLLIRGQPPATLEALVDTLAAIAGREVMPPTSASALDWDGVRMLAAEGFEIGAHTISHCVLPHLSPADVDRELAGSVEALETALGRRPRHFAYCNGYWSPRIMAALRRHGFISGLTTEDRLNRVGGDPMRIARRVLWEKSARGADGRTHPGLLACQLDDLWSALGLSSSEPGELEPAALPDVPLRRTA
ncbi:MAG: hypothetical protein RL199_994 [Pseudomonadota bacterium]|jgi:peptidoglycan/xylan/chitin deacetylase (PgdA/CDA1 family)